MVDTSVDVIDDVLEHHRDGRVGAAEEGGIAGDVLADAPEDAGLGGLGRAGAEELGAVEPDGGDAVVLLAGAGDGEVEDDASPWGGAVGGRGVGGGGRRGAVGVGEVVAEDGKRARRGAGGEEKRRAGGVDVFLGSRGGLGRGAENKAVSEGGGRGCAIGAIGVE